MKRKVDFHIHTRRTVSDSLEFEFDIDYLKDYVNMNNLDIIAITNHNSFCKEEYEEISETLKITVFPGVEVDIEKGHMLVIAPIEGLNEFIKQCAILESYIQNQNDYISYEEFIEIFYNHKSYLLIPHIDTKEPVVRKDIIEKFGDDIVSGEVRNHKKFLSYRKTENSLTPLVFSDHRMFKQTDTLTDQIKPFPVRFTVIDVGDVSIPSMKLALQDVKNVSITIDDRPEYIPILPDGTVASTKLNLIVGKRSSGKTTTVQQIASSFEDEHNKAIKLIQQFQIVNESSDKDYEEIKNEIMIEMAEDYLAKFKNTVETVMSYNYSYSNMEMESYITSLVTYAHNQSQKDVYSASKFYEDIAFDIRQPNSLNNLIKSVIAIIENVEEKAIIERHLDRESLIGLYNDLVIKYRGEIKKTRLKEYANNILTNIKNSLRTNSAIDPIKQINLLDEYKKIKSINIFNILSSEFRRTEIIAEKEIFNFKVILSRESFDNAASIKKIAKNGNHGESVRKHKRETAYDYLTELLSQGVDKNLLYKLLFRLDVKILNKRKAEISHGERAEFNLLRHIDDSRKYDIMLLDEPEASFDNPFINTYIIEQLRKIAEDTTVFVVTHNSTLGSSLKSNYILYTNVEYDDNHNAVYEVYSGDSSSTVLSTMLGKTKKNYEVLIETMEAGEIAYSERGGLYENLKDRK